MRTSIVIILMMTCIQISAQNKSGNTGKGFVISGKITGFIDGTSIHLIRNSDGTADTVSRAKLKDGKFRFSGNVKVPSEFYFIKYDTSSTYIRLLLDNSIFKVESSAESWPNAKVSGSLTHREFEKFNELLYPLYARSNMLQDSLGRLRPIDSMVRRDLTETINTVSKEIKDAYIKQITTHPNSAYTPALISGMFFLPLAETQEMYNNLTYLAKTSKYGKELKAFIEAKRIKEGIKVGAKAPDFSSLTQEGKKVNLSEIVKQHKLTLIDFWGSWCKPCRAETPNIKRVYDAFKNKGFNVLGIGLETSAENWKKAINEDRMDWKHVSQLKSREEDAAKIFAINGVPAYLLINGEGKIVAIDLPGSSIPSSGGSLRGETLYKKVEEILGKGK